MSYDFSVIFKIYFPYSWQLGNFCDPTTVFLTVDFQCEHHDVYLEGFPAK